MRVRHSLPSIPALSATVIAGLIEWVALWRSRRRDRTVRSQGA